MRTDYKVNFWEIIYSCDIYSAFKPFFPSNLTFNVAIFSYNNQGRLHKKRAGGASFSEGRQSYDFDIVIPLCRLFKQ